MATIAPNTERMETRAVWVRWSPLANGDDGTPFSYAYTTDRSVQVTGTFGTGGSITMQGSNDQVSPTNWFTLSDQAGSALTFTVAGFRQVLQTARWVRPIVTAGDGSTALSVAMMASG